MMVPVTANSLQLPDVLQTHSPRQKTIQETALQCLTELAFSLAISIPVCAFTATPAGITMILGAVAAQTILHTSIRCMEAFVKYKRRQTCEKDAKIKVQIANSICPQTFSWFTALNGQTLIHEGGHALAAVAFYKKSNPRIEIHPFKGASTFYRAAGLRSLGQKLGKKNVELIITAAGPFLSILVSSILFGLSLKTKEKHPQLSSYLDAAALLDFSIHASYALSALWTSPLKLSHDFVCLAQFGVHPIAAAIVIATIPIFINKTMNSRNET